MAPPGGLPNQAQEIISSYGRSFQDTRNRNARLQNSNPKIVEYGNTTTRWWFLTTEYNVDIVGYPRLHESRNEHKNASVLAMALASHKGAAGRCRRDNWHTPMYQHTHRDDHFFYRDVTEDCRRSIGSDKSVVDTLPLLAFPTLPVPLPCFDIAKEVRRMSLGSFSSL